MKARRRVRGLPHFVATPYTLGVWVHPSADNQSPGRDMRDRTTGAITEQANALPKLRGAFDADVASSDWRDQSGPTSQIAALIR